MSDVPMMWRDQNVDEMTREEAIEALKLCARLLDNAHKNTLEMHQFHYEMRELRARRNAA